MDTAIGFRGAMLNLKDCQCPTNLVGVVVCLKYPTCGLSAIPGVEVSLFEFLGKLFAWFPSPIPFVPCCHVSLVHLHFISRQLLYCGFLNDAF